MGDGNFRTPHRIHTPWPITKKFGTGACSAVPAAVPNLVQTRPRGLLGKRVTYNENFIYLFIYLYLFSETHLQVRPVDGFSRLMAQTTRTRTRVCLLGGFVDIALHLGGEIPRKPQLSGVNRRFQAKRAKYWKFHVIETTAPITTKFCTTIETTKWSSWVVQTGGQQIEDGAWPPFWKPLNRHISATVRLILMNFGTVTHIGPFWAHRL